jgi:hypothetical protein
VGGAAPDEALNSATRIEQKSKSPAMRGFSTFTLAFFHARTERLRVIAVRFERSDTLFELDDVRGLSKVRFTATLLGGFEPKAQFFDQECKHGVLQGL